MTSFDEILAKAAPPELVVPLIVGGNQLARIRELEQELKDAPPPMSLADRSPASAIGEQIAALQEEMRGTEVEFKLRAAPGRVWNRLQVARPVPQKDESEDAYADRVFAWTCAMLAATCVDPMMTVAQVETLAESLSGGAWDSLTNSAFTLNAGTVSVPFSPAAFAWTQSSAETSKRPPDSESPTAGSAAKAGRKRPPTSTTTTEDSPAL